MDEDATQHRADLMAHVVLIVGTAVMAAVLTVALVALTGCVVQVRQEDAPELVKHDDTVEPPVVSITRDGDSKDAPISIQAE